MTSPTPGSQRSRRWRWPAAAAIGAAAFAMSCAFVAPLRESRALGLDFAAMASDPFGWHGPSPHRLLGPLLAWLLGLGGERYWIWAHATVVVFLAFVAALAMQRGIGVVGAALLTAVVAVTGAVEVYKGTVGYAEPASYTLLLAGVMLVRRTAWFWLAMFLGLLNHEGCVFLWPWLLCVKRHENGLRRGDALGFAVAVATYAAIRWSIFAASKQPLHSAEVYMGGPLTLDTLAMWVEAGFFVVVYFGVLPMLLAWHARAAGWRAAGVPILLAVAAIFAMCTFATDQPRFVGYLALPVVLAGVALLQRPRGAPWLGVLGVATAVAIVLQRRVVSMLTEEGLKRAPDPVPKLVVDLWPVFAAYALAVAAMIAIGVVLARRPRSAGQPD